MTASTPKSQSADGILGIDFGTSNSAIAWVTPQGTAQPIPLEGDALAMPTAVFYNAEEGSTHFGREAVTHYLEGTEGRLMRSLKSLLGSPLLMETTVINNQLVNFSDIITTYLAELRKRAAQHLGTAPTRVVMGRPVHFVDDDAERDAQAESSLRQAAEAVGFKDIAFQFEPIAAALDYERRLTRETTVLVADIGGGTSDFTVVRLGPALMHKTNRADDVLATTGVHIGGTDFDQKLSLGEVMPLLGYGHLGPDSREVPNRVFFDLSTWHLINWQYQPKAMAQAKALQTNYTDTRLHDRLMRVLTERYGHHIAHDVEQAKIRCSQTDGDTHIDLSYVEKNLAAKLGSANLHTNLAQLLTNTIACARECVQRAELTHGKPDAIYLTGGSSALRAFQEALQAEFVGVPLVEGDLFGGVASDLVYSRH
jgi:hypothetical chaperone protein